MYFRIWHVEKHSIQNLTRWKSQLKSWFLENFQSQKSILEMQAECKNCRLYKEKKIEIFFNPYLFCKNRLFGNEIKIQTVTRSEKLDLESDNLLSNNFSSEREAMRSF